MTGQLEETGLVSAHFKESMKTAWIYTYISLIHLSTGVQPHSAKIPLQFSGAVSAWCFGAIKSSQDSNFEKVSPYKHKQRGRSNFIKLKTGDVNLR